jgi:hypothetical protein
MTYSPEDIFGESDFEQFTAIATDGKDKILIAVETDSKSVIYQFSGLVLGKDEDDFKMEILADNLESPVVKLSLTKHTLLIINKSSKA